MQLVHPIALDSHSGNASYPNATASHVNDLASY